MYLLTVALIHVKGMVIPVNKTFISTYLFVNKKSSKVFASSGHMLSNFPEEACWRATGNPTESTLSKEDTASFHVLSEGQAYFRLNGTLRVWENYKNTNITNTNITNIIFRHL